MAKLTSALRPIVNTLLRENQDSALLDLQIGWLQYGDEIVSLQQRRTDVAILIRCRQRCCFRQK